LNIQAKIKLVCILSIFLNATAFGQNRISISDSLTNLVSKHHKLIYSSKDTTVALKSYGLHGDSTIQPVKVKLQFDRGGNLLIAEHIIESPNKFIWLYFSQGDFVLARLVDDNTGEVTEMYYPYGTKTNYYVASWHVRLALAVIEVMNRKK
jgi:hypothetical protein